MNAKTLILVAVFTLNTKTSSCDDDCIVTSHSDEESDSVNVCFKKREVQLLTCSGDKNLIITDVIQRIKRKHCSTTEECCKVKDSDLFEETHNCKKANPTLTALLTEIIRKCNGRKFCYFLEPKSSIWPFIKEGKHQNASHLKISYKCNNWPRYDMCGNTSKAVTTPFYISTSSENHSNCSCDIYTKEKEVFFLYVMEVTLGSNLGNNFTIGNSTYKKIFTGGGDTLALNRNLGSWSKVFVILETNKQKTTADVLVQVKGTAKNVQLNCSGVTTGKGSTMTKNKSNDSIKCPRRFIGLLFASGFFAACFAIGLIGSCLVMRKRKSSHMSSAVTNTKTSDKTGNGADSQRRANEIVRPGPSRQDASADESDRKDEDAYDLAFYPKAPPRAKGKRKCIKVPEESSETDKKDEEAEHLYSFPFRLSSDGSVSAHRRSAISEKGSLHVDLEESSSCQQIKAGCAYDLECYPEAPPRAKGKRKSMKVPEESSETDTGLERYETVVVDIDKVVVVDL